jgi:1-acyl-sn-glycerol-3-phosphate acyltransferase
MKWSIGWSKLYKVGAGMVHDAPGPPLQSPAVSAPAPPTYHRSLPKLLWYRLAQFGLSVAGLLLFGVKRRGVNNVPTHGPVVLLANHQSHLDPAVVGCYCRRPLGFLARDTLFTGSLGKLIRSFEAIPIDREGSGLAGIRATLKRLKQGDAILMFPEGTRSEDGQLQPLKPGFISLVRRGGAAIVPVAIAGAHRALPRGSRFPRRVPLAIDFGAPMSADTIATLDDSELLTLLSARLAEGLQRGESLIARD